MKKYESEMRVIFADTDAMGIVYHTNYVKWFEIGRNEYLRQIGYPYSKLEKEGLWLPVIRVECDYKLPAVYDDVLLIRAWVGELGPASVTMEYEILRKETMEILVMGKTRHAITNSKMKPIRLRSYSKEFYERIKEDLY